MKWLEAGDRVFTRRYAFFNQQIGVVLGGREVLVVDTRSTPAQAREIVEDIRELTQQPVSIVVDTHWHFDHSFGNSVFRPAEIWGHVRAAERLRSDGLKAKEGFIVQLPEIADDLREVEIDPPERTLADRASLDLGGRVVELSYHGRAHTDGDIVVVVPDANVLFAGDLLEEGAPPNFGDGYTLEWPETVESFLPLVTGAVVPGHGAAGARPFVEDQLTAFRRLAELSREVHAGSLDLEAAIAIAPFEPEASRDALERGLAQLRGELP